MPELVSVIESNTGQHQKITCTIPRITAKFSYRKSTSIRCIDISWYCNTVFLREHVRMAIILASSIKAA
ncbi:hypothetical protein XF_1032 [Xylella fastidiosa 9a5c]|uniref:Uncharacterized protein n=1 Tax=Xylella fastidiosa (strain 9a5c) TaxID=160492 RepID=Q9PEJ6_XYLFA|nr:hypothetical protein XF_1032 [Xylella fastidiosa 9a5c]